MAMRMTGIEVICGDPVEPRAKIDFHLPHQVADKRFEVGEFGGVLRRHDEAELVAVAFAALDECLTVGSIAARIVKLAGSPLARDAISLRHRPCPTCLFRFSPNCERNSKRRQIAARTAVAKMRESEFATLSRSRRFNRSKKGEQLEEQVPVTAYHEFGALGDQPPGAVFEELARSLPFLGYSFLAKDGDRDLPIALAGEAFIEGDQGVMQPFVDRKWRSTGGRRLFCKAMEALQ